MVKPLSTQAAPAPDASVLAAARRAEPWAQRQIVLHLQAPVHRLMWRMLGSAGRSELAQDLTQDALLRIVRALPGFRDDGEAKFRTWALTIATRCAIDELRRRPLPTVAMMSSAASDAVLPDLAIERAAIGGAIAAAIDELAPEIRATFVLRAYHDMDYRDIAEALEIDLGTVKSRLWRARAALQRRLEGLRHG
ncbi:MAG: sigma-70 family RNA polymerase sigma factor [Deltaproteobacteria bacterium]|nr:sigma-70 family RNA polymerase sigma factor [Deltaproteobacteria bacterium]MBK8240150.1 sigma-70 family RNA polymerase sigma factor [Deltaproteobacteria bacterium]MBK8715862.1 sigma-70 family RNA polymerase sigma factor [Deltaproteobacteria bacterium]MBP7286592.1 sigma-70 family RNA polymerase sigma factor [Nannocystaceae bacterium]